MTNIPRIGFMMIFLYGSLFALKLHAQNDTLVLKNKDKIVGEIKQMDQGVLTIETDYSEDDFTITWLDVISVVSAQDYLLTLSDGRRLNGHLETPKGQEGQVVIKVNEVQVDTLKLSEIVYIKAVETNFLSRLTASLSVGFNYTKSNNLSQLTVRSTLSYTAYKFLLTGSYNSVRSNQDAVEETQRTDANLTYKFFMGRKNRFYELTASFLSNDEQLLKLRSTVRSGVGQYFVRSNKLYFGAGVGLAWNNEQFTDVSKTNQNSLEAYGGVVLNLFDVKDFSLDTGLVVYPSLTESSRVRCDYNLDLKYDLPLDFFIKLGLTYNYDSKPVAGASVSDYVFQTTLGWDFNN